jgi:hypothetical protein
MSRWLPTFRISAVTFVVLAAQASAQDYDKMKQQLADQAKELAASYDKKIDEMEKEMSEKKKSIYNADVKRANELHAKIEKAKKAKAAALVASGRVEPQDLKVGFFGKLQTARPIIPANVPAHVAARREQKAGDGIPVFRIMQVVDEDNAIMGWEDKTFWVEMPTAGKVDGDQIRVVDYVHCKGTKTYTTVTGGTLTCLQLKFVK